MPDESYPSGDRVAQARHVTVNGRTMRVVTGGEPDAPLGLLLHGWGASAWSFRSLTERLVDSGLSVLVPDLPGHGGSDKPSDPAQYSSGAMMASVAGLLDGLGARPAVVVGQSLGGAIAMDLASNRPDLVPALVLVASIGFTSLGRVSVLRRWPLSHLWPRSMPRQAVELTLRRIYGTRRQFGERDVDEYWMPLRDPAASQALHLLVQNFDFSPRSEAGLSYLGPRLSMLFGELDRPIPLGKALAHARRFPQASVSVLEGVGHVPAEEAPEEVAGAVRALLADVLHPGRTARQAGTRPA